MKQVWITRAGGPEVLEVREAADPEPAPGEVLVDVRAAGVNFADTIARNGKYAAAPPIPCVVGYEVAGEVRAVGEMPPGAESEGAAGSGTRALRPGDRVFGMTRFGGYSSVVAAPAVQFFRMPDRMSFQDAAAISVSYLTAYISMVRQCNLQAGERCLIHNAGGSVGVAAIQLAKMIGAEVYGTASGWKHEKLREQGADVLIDYRTGDWVAELKRVTGGAGVHVILDPVGGSNLKKDIEVMAPLARLGAFGFSEPVRGGNRKLVPTLRSLFAMPRLKMLTLFSRNLTVSGLNMAHLWSEFARLASAASELTAAWEAGHLKPVIAGEFPFEEAAEAHRMLDDRRNLGKVLLIP